MWDIARYTTWALFIGLIIACGSPSPPNFEQDGEGTYDLPCPPPAPSVLCRAHVRLLNAGGAGTGVVTLTVDLQSAAHVASPPRAPSSSCRAVIPNTPAGDYAEASCAFRVAADLQVVGLPQVTHVDNSAVETSGASDQLTVATWVLGLFTLGVAVGTAYLAYSTRTVAKAEHASLENVRDQTRIQQESLDDLRKQTGLLFDAAQPLLRVALGTPVTDDHVKGSAIATGVSVWLWDSSGPEAQLFLYRLDHLLPGHSEPVLVSKIGIEQRPPTLSKAQANARAEIWAGAEWSGPRGNDATWVPFSDTRVVAEPQYFPNRDQP